MTDRNELTWWGHSAVAITLDGVRLVTDPLLRARIGSLHSVGHRPANSDVADVDVVLLSHLHRDHTDLPSLARFPARTRVVVPAGGATLLQGRMTAQVQEIDIDETATFGPVHVRAVRAVHDGRRGFGGPEAGALGYLLSGSRRVYFAGDSDLFEAMADLPGLGCGPIDVALVPVSGWGLTLGAGHMDASRAAQAVRLLRPVAAVPIHWGTLRIPLLWRARGAAASGAAVAFAEEVARVAPDVHVVLPRPGEALTIPLAAQFPD